MVKHKMEHESIFTKQFTELRMKKDKLWDSRDKLEGDYSSWKLKEEDFKTVSTWSEDE